MMSQNENDKKLIYWALEDENSKIFSNVTPVKSIESYSNIHLLIYDKSLTLELVKWNIVSTR